MNRASDNAEISPHDGDGHRMRPQTLGCRSLANVPSEQLRPWSVPHSTAGAGEAEEGNEPPQIPVLVRLMAQNNSTGRGMGSMAGALRSF